MKYITNVLRRDGMETKIKLSTEPRVANSIQVSKTSLAQTKFEIFQSEGQK